MGHGGIPVSPVASCTIPCSLPLVWTRGLVMGERQTVRAARLLPAEASREPSGSAPGPESLPCAHLLVRRPLPFVTVPRGVLCHTPAMLLLFLPLPPVLIPTGVRVGAECAGGVTALHRSRQQRRCMGSHLVRAWGTVEGWGNGMGWTGALRRQAGQR